MYYAYPPPGFWLLCREAGIEFKRGQVLELKKAIYGLVNASRDWNVLFTTWMVEEQSFVQCQHDPGSRDPGPILWHGAEARATQWPYLCFHGELHQASD